MLLVTGFGVTFSTFLSGPVALMASISAIVLGLLRPVRPRHRARGAAVWRRADRIVHSHHHPAERDDRSGDEHDRRQDHQGDRRRADAPAAGRDVHPARLHAVRHDRVRRRRLQHLWLAGRPAVDDGGRLFHRRHDRRLLLPQDAGDRRMNRSASFTRKIAYIAAIALLLLPIAALSQPATVEPRPGGQLGRAASWRSCASSTTWLRRSWARSTRPARR